MQKRRIVIAAAVLAGAVSLAACGSDKKDSGASVTPSDNKPTAAAVSWPAPADATAQAKAAGLPMLGQEGQVLHIHSHLDVFVDGRPVTVPAEIGIDLVNQRISPLHTHDTSGVVHIESPVKRDFTLGEFMTEWHVPISKDALGPLKTGGGKELHVYVNGKERAGDPASLKLGAHDEIAVVYGTANEKVHVPAAYNWPQGL
jgi:predicted small secreted protein